MRNLPLSLIALAAAALVAVGCGGDEEEPSAAGDSEAAPTTETSAGKPDAQEPSPGSGEQPNPASLKPERRGTPEPKRAGVAIETAASQVGEVLFDGEDQAIYLFDKETSSTPECYGECAAEWPPVLTDGRPRAKGAVSQEELGVTERDDGSLQVTYNGHPLYYYAHEAPGELRCHNVPGFGGLWLALDAAGNPA